MEHLLVFNKRKRSCKLGLLLLPSTFSFCLTVQNNLSTMGASIHWLATTLSLAYVKKLPTLYHVFCNTSFSYIQMHTHTHTHTTRKTAFVQRKWLDGQQLMPKKQFSEGMYTCMHCFYFKVWSCLN